MNSSIRLQIAGWGAYAPGLVSPADWRAWAQAPWPPRGVAAPPLEGVPPMQRRRIDPLGRLAVQAALNACHGVERPGPSVFVSRRGDARCALALLSALVANEPLSPTAFGGSVHNAIAAQWSMLRADRSSYDALSAGTSGVEQALCHCAGLLADGAGEVLLVVFEAPVPAAFSKFVDEPDADFAWAWRIRSAGEGPHMILEAETSIAPTPVGSLPCALQPLRFWLSGASAEIHDDGHTRWRWQRDG